MNRLEKLYPVFILTAAAAGLALGTVDAVPPAAQAVITPFLMIMLTAAFYPISFQGLRAACSSRRFAGAALLINFVWTPLFAWVLAGLFLGDHPALWIGFVMLMVTPCTDWYIVFTKLARGNMALAAALLPLNLVLQVLLLPAYLLLFTGASGTIAPGVLIETIVFILGIPFLAAAALRFAASARRNWKKRIDAVTAPLPVLFLCLAVAAMFASQGTLLPANMELLLLLLMPILLFFTVNFGISWFGGGFIGLDGAGRVSLTMTTLARNSPAALAIALAAFPGEPLIALTLLIGPLLEIPVLAAVTQLLLRLRG
ncbi:arsenic resistance protein [Alkalicoccus urumqiensis]|uniref:Arsenic resistance protein n=1 Tax=Alkalicoccus urumqiensis TaxID=1548213 RepID=A0A2P6MLI7_ALKUR|nr:bile acid:sodium symporter [Alkalicoccus urumqiensis]PRO67142.1 arsenic resistance protein [Alkalicoccus urumqiensis]